MKKNQRERKKINNALFTAVICLTKTGLERILTGSSKANILYYEPKPILSA